MIIFHCPSYFRRVFFWQQMKRRLLDILYLETINLKQGKSNYQLKLGKNLINLQKRVQTVIIGHLKPIHHGHYLYMLGYVRKMIDIQRVFFLRQLDLPKSQVRSNWTSHLYGYCGRSGYSVYLRPQFLILFPPQGSI